MKKLITILSVAVFALAAVVNTSHAAASFFNGFEVDTSDWNGFGGTIVRTASGTDSITSATGDYHAVIDGSVFTRWGGYESVFPTNGYMTSIDMYLDMSEADGADKRMDFSSAINNPAGAHRRDFIFAIGTVAGTGPTGEWAVSASNNAPGWPLNPARTPITINQTGWYTFEHTFLNNAGVLEVVMKVKDSSDTVLGSWTLSDPSDLIGTTVGGNRYGWFTSQRFDFDALAIDNSMKQEVVPVVGPPENKNECKQDGWMLFNNPTFKNQGDCVSYVQSNERASGNKNK